MKVKNMTSSNGNKVANQFVIYTTENDIHGEWDVEFFQSYDSIIVKRTWRVNRWFIEFDEKYWDYSRTTSKYRNQFTGLTTKETEAKIKSGEIKLVNLN